MQYVSPSLSLLAALTLTSPSLAQALIRGAEQYHNPAESYPLQLPGGHRDMWYGGNGTYLLSNEAGFNPNVG